MFLVKVYPSKSDIEGIGVFTQEKIKKDQLVWILNPNFDRVWTVFEFLRLPLIARENIYKYAYINHDGFVVHHVDNGNFLNHHDKYNLLYKDKALYANREIVIGEELTIDYSAFVKADPPK